MRTTIQNPYIYNYSENVSDFLIGFLEDNDEQNWSNYQTQKLSNPKITFFEQRIAALEGGVAALAVKSFNKAKLSVVKGLLKAGENVVTYNSLRLFTRDKARLNRVGIEVRLSEDGELNTFRKLIDENTKLIYLETISEEFLNIPDFQKIVTLAKEKNIPIVVDNTAGAAGYIARPIKSGANIVIESTKNWLPSHKSIIGAVIIDGGNYNWQNGKFPQFTDAKLNFFEIAAGSLRGKTNPVTFSLINYLKKEGNINYNSDTIPDEPLELIHDLENIPNVVKASSDNALALALWLKEQEWVKDVNYTGLPSNKSYSKALTNFRNGFGDRLSFTIKNSSVLFPLIQALKSEQNVIKNNIQLENDKIKITAPSSSIIEIQEFLTQILSDKFIYKIHGIKEQNDYKELTSLNSIF